MSTILVTGFEPFGGEQINPSAEVARSLDATSVQGRRVVGVVLPCVFLRAQRMLLQQLERTQPELVICLGQAGGRAALGIERVAINLNDAPIADNAGRRPVDRPVVRGGPVGYWSTLPIKALVQTLTRAGLPAEVSQTAGTFVCNHVFYVLMHALSTPARHAVRGGFVHLPFLPSQVGRLRAPSLPLADAVRAVELCLETTLRRRRDVRASAARADG
ncbi:MAG: pyroglutamyl-peptidase I [Polyangiaceae bacterium]